MLARLPRAAVVAVGVVLLALLPTQPARAAVVLDFETSVDGCNNNDVSARAVVEQYLGDGVVDFSLYNTTRDFRSAPVQLLKGVVFDYLEGEITIDEEFLQELGIEYGLTLTGYVAPAVISLVFLTLLGLPLIFVRCCCARVCCAPHHPLWGQDNGTLEDFPEPKCCAGSRRQKPKTFETPTQQFGSNSKAPHNPAANGNPVRPYTYWEQCSPVFFYILFAAGLVGVSISGTLSVGTIVSGLDGSVCSVDILLVEAQNFTYGLSDAVGTMLGVAVEVLDTVAEIVNSTRGVGDVAANVSAAGDTAIAGIDALLARTGSSYTFDSATLDSSLDLLNNAASSLDETLDDVMEIIVNPRNTVLSIVGMLDGITNMTDGLFLQAHAVLHETEIDIPAIPFLTDGTPLVGALGATAILENNAYTLGSVFFALACVSIPFTVFGILVMGPKCAHKPHDSKSKTTCQCCGLLFSRLSCLWLFMTMFIASIPALLLFPFGVIVSDVCYIFEDFGTDTGPYVEALVPFLFPEESSGGSVTTTTASGGGGGMAFNFDMASGVEAAVSACFNDESLLEALNITSVLQAYVSTVDFSVAEGLDLESVVDIDALTASMDTLISSTDVYAILAPFNSTDEANLGTACSSCTGFGAAAHALNQLPFYTTNIDAAARASMDSCSDCSSGTFLISGVPQNCGDWQDIFCTVDGNVTSITADLGNIQSSFSVVNSGLQSMFGDLQELQADLAEVAGNVSDLAASVSTLDAFAQCGFIGEFYNAMVASLCPGSTSGLLWLGYSLNIMVITCLFIIVDIIVINCRLGGVGQPRHHSDPKNFLPKNIPKFFNGPPPGSGGHSNARVAPMSHQPAPVGSAGAGGNRLSTAESVEAQNFIARAKADDSNAHVAGVAM